MMRASRSRLRALTSALFEKEGEPGSSVSVLVIIIIIIIGGKQYPIAQLPPYQSLWACRGKGEEKT